MMSKKMIAVPQMSPLIKGLIKEALMAGKEPSAKNEKQANQIVASLESRWSVIQAEMRQGLPAALVLPQETARSDFDQVVRQQLIADMGETISHIKAAFPYLNALSWPDFYAHVRKIVPLNWQNRVATLVSDWGYPNGVAAEGHLLVEQGDAGLSIRNISDSATIPIENSQLAKHVILNRNVLFFVQAQQMVVQDLTSNSRQTIQVPENIAALAVSKAYIAAATESGVIVYRRENLAAVHTHRIDQVSCLDLSDGGHLVVGCRDGSLIVIQSCDQSDAVFIPKAHDDAISHVRRFGDSIVSAAGVGVRVWHSVSKFTNPFAQSRPNLSKHSVNITDLAVISFADRDPSGHEMTRHFILSLGTRLSVRDENLNRIYELEAPAQSRIIPSPYYLWVSAPSGGNFWDFSGPFDRDHRPSLVVDLAGKGAEKLTSGLGYIASSAASSIGQMFQQVYPTKS